MKQYPKYKDSGIQWIGQIPEEWKVINFKYCFMTSTGLNISKSDLVEDGIAVISYGQIHSKSNTRTHLSDELVRYIPEKLIIGKYNCKLRKNDLVFADTSEDLEGCGNAVFIDSDKEIYAGYHTIIARPIIDGEVKYLAYLFNTQEWRKQIREKVVGIKVYSITQNLLNNCTIILPSEAEQQTIVRYLDNKTSKIDECIRLLELQKTDLANYRKAIISQVVTRGLNPNAKLKDSGTEWIGQIPENWAITRIKNIANDEINSFCDGDWIESPYIEESGIRYLTSGNIGDGKFKRQGKGYISEKTFVDLGCKFAYPGDLVFCRLNAPYGRSCILPIDEDRYVIAVDNVILRTNEDKRYICYFTQTVIYQQYIEQICNGMAMQRISRKKLGDIAIPIPPRAEQQAIVDYLDTKTAKIDETIANIDAQIADLRDYRSALISDVVIGKIDVRNAN